MNEQQLVSKIVNKLEAYPDLISTSEVPIFGRVADIAYLRNNELITIECKLKNWRRALQQANEHQIAADKAYICLPKRSITDFMLEEISRVGVGLLFFDEDGSWPFETIIDAKKSAMTWQSLKTIVSNQIITRRGSLAS